MPKRVLFVQTSTLPSSMHQKLTEHGSCIQNNQLLIKCNIELKDIKYASILTLIVLFGFDWLIYLTVLWNRWLPQWITCMHLYNLCTQLPWKYVGILLVIVRHVTTSCCCRECYPWWLSCLMFSYFLVSWINFLPLLLISSFKYDL